MAKTSLERYAHSRENLDLPETTKAAPAVQACSEAEANFQEGKVDGATFYWPAELQLLCRSVTGIGTRDMQG